MSQSGIFAKSATWLIVAFTTLVIAGEPQVLWQGELSKKSKPIEGTVRIEATAGERSIVFDADFKTKAGPDLKVVLSPLPFSEINGKNAMKNARVIALLTSVSGSQRYAIPADVDLSAMKSLLIHCEKYSVLWGGAALD